MGQVSKPTLKDLGFTRKESSQAQLLAILPIEDVEAVNGGQKTIMEANREAIMEMVIENEGLHLYTSEH